MDRGLTVSPGRITSTSANMFGVLINGANDIMGPITNSETVHGHHLTTPGDNAIEYLVDNVQLVKHHIAGLGDTAIENPVGNNQLIAHHIAGLGDNAIEHPVDNIQLVPHHIAALCDNAIEHPADNSQLITHHPVADQSIMPTNNEPERRIPRPRNQFILYRQWMSRKLRAENPGLTAGSISQIVASLWRTENDTVREHFQKLAKKDEERHRLKYPDYRYEARRVGPANPRRVFQPLIHPAQHLILTGFYKN